MTSKLALLRNRIVALQQEIDANTLRQYQQSANLAMTPFKLLLALLVVSALGFPASSLPLAGAATTARYVAPTGSDSNPGTLEQPRRTITKALRALRPGYTLYVRGGTYAERVTGFTLPSGTNNARITVKAYPGERPIVKGLLWLKGANYWTFDGINVTWEPTTGLYNEHMLKFTDGTGWVYTNAEIWGARFFAAILISGAPMSYTLSDLNVHDTYATNSTAQDHLIYINSYAGGSGGVIERSLLWNSPNGRAIKIGPSAASTTRLGNVTIRYNTMFNNLGPTNINLSYGASDNRIERNIMQKVGTRKSNVDTTSLNGTNNVVLNNVGWESTGVMAVVPGLSDGGGNQLIDPQLRAPANGDFYPENVTAQDYGRYASLAAPVVTIMTPTSNPSATPSSAPASTSTPIATSTPIRTASPTSTPTTPPTNTPMPTSTATRMATSTPTTPPTSPSLPTATHTSTPTATALPTGTAIPVATSMLAATSTTQPSAGSAFSFTPVADTYVDQASSGSAYGSSSTFSAVGGSTSAKQAFLRFDVSGLPAGASVSSAKLRLFVTNDSTSGGIFQRVTNNSWAETITWSTKPAIDGAQLASVGAVMLNEAVEVVLPAGTITGNGSYSFAITLPSSNTNALGYASRQNATIANRPQLLITTQ